ncbi:hypothetical protein C5613_34750 [Rhodococcus opacus]|uniref:Uncharacterized protein n=1 Tax=Rhodococcus opacus TaxID=37919 RepID=A0A2S8IR87_RHOOP|nr:hypothetical protein C5613_34750 [Rhodococcus opacus]
MHRPAAAPRASARFKRAAHHPPRPTPTPHPAGRTRTPAPRYRRRAPTPRPNPPRCPRWP